jgi:peroxidase
MSAFVKWVEGIGGRRGRRRPTRPRFETLEDRCVPATAFYSIDGTGNHTSDPNDPTYYWGSVGQDLLRVAPAQYGDGISTLAGANRPSARLISTTIATDSTDGETPNSRFMADWVYAWGQFIDHDIDLTSTQAGPQAEAADIAVPKGDPYFDPNKTGTQGIDFTRSEYDPNTGSPTTGPRQQINDITAFLDASMIYGSDLTRADALRAHYGGRLLTLGDQTGNPALDGFLPFNTFGLANANSGPMPDNQLFLAGDVRANENIELTSVHTLFLREHNRIAGIIAQQNSTWTDDQIYQTTRAIVIAEVQSITFNEFLPALLGPNVLTLYGGYNPNVNPGIATEFSTAGFRLGHSLLASDVEFLNPDGTTKFPQVSLANAFFNPTVFLNNGGADPILKYLASDNAQEIDNKIVPELQNFLFGPPGAGGFDLASLNIQRGRDHGLADYNTTRVAYGLPAVTTFAQITSNKTVQQALKKLYGTVDNIDLWVGALAEDHVAGGSVGPLIQQIVAQQFQNIRDGDRLWFENLYTGADLDAFENTTLAQIIDRNTVNHDLQSNVFFFKIQITGTLFNDANGNGVQDPGEAGLQGRVIQAFDHATGALIAYTLTDANGNYSFDNLSAGLEPAVGYDVRQQLKAQQVQTTPPPPTITFSRGATVSGVNFGQGRNKSNSLTSLPITITTGTTTGTLDDAIVDIIQTLNA